MGKARHLSAPDPAALMARDCMGENVKSQNKTDSQEVLAIFKARSLEVLRNKLEAEETLENVHLNQQQVKGNDLSSYHVAGRVAPFP